MKKIVLALVAVFAMSTMTMAQIELNLDKAQNQQELTIGNAFSEMEQSSDFDFDLGQLQDLSFSSENGMVKFENNKSGNDAVIGAILAIFLGDFGIHHFYSGDTKHGIWHLVFFWTGIPGLIGFIEGIMWLIDAGTYPNPLINI